MLSAKQSLLEVAQHKLMVDVTRRNNLMEMIVGTNLLLMAQNEVKLYCFDF